MEIFVCNIKEALKFFTMSVVSQYRVQIKVCCIWFKALIVMVIGDFQILTSLDMEN